MDRDFEAPPTDRELLEAIYAATVDTIDIPPEDRYAGNDGTGGLTVSPFYTGHSFEPYTVRFHWYPNHIQISIAHYSRGEVWTRRLRYH